MKKFLTIFLAVFLPMISHAQTKPQVLVFAGFAGRSEVEGIYQFGAGMKFASKYGFTFQPEIFYDKRYTEFYTHANNTFSTVYMTAPFLEIPVQIQWGKDFGGIRPYVFVSPFVGFGLGKVRGDFGLRPLNSNDKVNYIATSFKDAGMIPLIIGGGGGIGIEALDHFQISVQYNSSAFDLVNNNPENAVVKEFWTNYKDSGKKGRRFFEDFYFQVALLF